MERWGPVWMRVLKSAGEKALQEEIARQQAVGSVTFTDPAAPFYPDPDRKCTRLDSSHW